MNKKIIFMIVLFGGLASGAIWLYFNLVGFKINSAPKTEPEIASCGYTNAQATSDYTFDINSIPVVNLQIDVAKDAIVEEYIEGLTVNISDSLPKNNYSELTGKLKARGNSSYSAGKKYGALPYKIKLDETVDLFGFGENAEWLLLPNFIDPTYSRQFLGFYISQLIMGEDYFQPDAKYVEVYLNGEYQGLYLLAESIEESENRLNIKTCYNPDSSNTPFIVELGFAKGDETIFDENLMFMVNDTIPSQCGSTNIIYDLKYPEKFSEVPTLQAEYIKNTMNKLHEGIKVNKPLDKLGIDIQSFINYFLVQELLLIGDFGITSVYYYSNGTTIFAGPAWDFDNISSMPATGFLQPEADNTLYRGLLQYPEFKEAFIKRFDEVYPKLVSALSSKIDHMKNNKLLNDAVTKHDGLYNRNSRTDLSGEWWAQNPAADNIHSFTNHLNYIQHWLLDGLDTESEGRLEWLKNHIDEL